MQQAYSRKRPVSEVEPLSPVTLAIQTSITCYPCSRLHMAGWCGYSIAAWCRSPSMPSAGRGSSARRTSYGPPEDLGGRDHHAAVRDQVHDDDLESSVGGLRQAHRRRAQCNSHPGPLPAPCRDHHNHRSQLPDEGSSRQGSPSPRSLRKAARRTRGLPGTEEVKYTTARITGRF